MKIQGFDHLVLNVQDLDRSLNFYGQVLGLKVLRLDEFRRREVPFPSVRISSDALIDLVQGPRPPDGANVDHFCLIIEPTDMDKLPMELEALGIEVIRDVGRRWGAHGWGLSLNIKDPDGNSIELKCHPPGFS